MEVESGAGDEPLQHVPHFVVGILGHEPPRPDWTLSQIDSSIIKRFFFLFFCLRLATRLKIGTLWPISLNTPSRGTDLIWD